MINYHTDSFIYIFIFRLWKQESKWMCRQKEYIKQSINLAHSLPLTQMGYFCFSASGNEHTDK